MCGVGGWEDGGGEGVRDGAGGGGEGEGGRATFNLTRGVPRWAEISAAYVIIKVAGC